jgi:hypothetical protein
MLETTKARDTVVELARVQPAEAFRVARRISDPWFSVQALAWVARLAPPELAADAIKEARATAKAGRDAYQRCAVLAWPIRAAIEAGRIEDAAGIVADACALLPKVRATVSRVEAGGLLLEAAFPGGRPLWAPVLATLEASGLQDSDRRLGRLLRMMALVVVAEDPAAALRLAQALPKGRDRERALKEVGNGAAATPKAFFC